MVRIRPPEDITPAEFFTLWVPAAVSADPGRRARLGETRAAIEFTVDGDEGGVFTLSIDAGVVDGCLGAAEDANLRVRVDLETWRSLNRGDLGAPEALLRRKLRLEGDFLLGLKLHLILSFGHDPPAA